MSPITKPANNLYQLLKRLVSAEDSTDWVSATVLTKYRSSYRKPGAMMLVNPFGQTFGLISGGCLESDIALRARRVLEYRTPEYVIYDSMEDGNIAAELGLGCNGRIGVVVEEVSPRHRQLFAHLLERMNDGVPSYLLHAFCDQGERSGLYALLDKQLKPVFLIGEETTLPSFLDYDPAQTPVLQHEGYSWTLTEIKPPVRLLIAGGGIDAQPVAALAASLGWRVTVADHRTVHARKANFPGVETLITDPPYELPGPPVADAVIVMSHNLEMDAQWLTCCRNLPDLKYLGLLGPEDRKEEVLSIAGLSPEDPLSQRIHGPMGIDIGGDLPESVAVSVIAQCHLVLASAGLV